MGRDEVELSHAGYAMNKYSKQARHENFWPREHRTKQPPRKPQGRQEMGIEAEDNGKGPCACRPGHLTSWMRDWLQGMAGEPQAESRTRTSACFHRTLELRLRAVLLSAWKMKSISCSIKRGKKARKFKLPRPFIRYHEKVATGTHSQPASEASCVA